MNKKKIYVSTVALIDWQGKVLLSLRSKGKGFSNFWEFPGGKIQTKENPDDAAIRELYEELSIKVSKDSLKPLTFTSHSYSQFDAIIFFYICRLWKGVIVSKEKQKLLWIKINQINNYKILPGSKKLAAELVSFYKKK